MPNLIPLTQDNDGITAVMGRDLHEFLGIKSNYTEWFSRMVEYGFDAGQDFIRKNESNGKGRPTANHVITLDMAKEVSMIQRTDKGKQAREYFIEAEKQYRRNSAAPTVAAPALPGSYIEALEALLSSEKQRAEVESVNARQTNELEAAHPKVEAYDTLMVADDTYSLGTAAKMLGIGRNTFTRFLRDSGILITAGNMYNTPRQEYIHHFKVIMSTYRRPRDKDDERTGATYTTHVKPSGIDYLRKKLHNLVTN